VLAFDLQLFTLRLLFRVRLGGGSGELIERHVAAGWGSGFEQSFCAAFGIGKAEVRSRRGRAGVRSQETEVRSQHEEHPVRTFSRVFRAMRSLLTAWVFLPDQKPLRPGQQCKPWAKLTGMGREERPAVGGAERFDPFRVEELGWDAIRGRRAQNPRPCPRLLIFNPFGVQTRRRGILTSEGRSFPSLVKEGPGVVGP
jgi:hypothetical protein